MAKKVQIEVDIDSKDVEGTTKQLIALRKQLKETAAGSSEFKRLTAEIKDLEDTLEAGKNSAKSFADRLEEAPGPLGAFAKGFKTLEMNTKSFGTALKATGIGLLVSTIGLLVGAFTESESAMKKLQPVMDAFQKILGGIFAVFEPLLDTFVEFALQILPIATKAIGIYYSAMFALFGFIKDNAMGIYKVLKGVFTLNSDLISEGTEQISNSISNAVESFNESRKRFEQGTKELTKNEKEQQKLREEAAQKAREAAKKALEDKIKRMEQEDALDEARLQKMKAEAMALAETEQEKLDIEKKFADLSYKALMQNILDKQKLYSKDSEEFKKLETDKIKAEADYISQLSGFKEKQKSINDKAAEKAKEDLQKQIDERNALLFAGYQEEIRQLDELNRRYDNDFQQDIQRFEEQKRIIEEQRAIELAAAENDNLKKLEIQKKYAEQLGQVEKDITATQQSEIEARIGLQLMYAETVAMFGGFLSAVAGKNADLAKAGLILEKGSAIATIIINTQKAASKIAATSPLGFLDPRAILTYTQGGISVATTIAAANKGIQDIDAAAKKAAEEAAKKAPLPTMGGRNYAQGGLIYGRRHAQGGVMVEAEGGEAIMTRGAVTMFGPLLSAMNQMGGGTSFANNLVSSPDVPETSSPALNNATPIIKTYVVSSELTSEAERQARLKDLSVL